MTLQFFKFTTVVVFGVVAALGCAKKEDDKEKELDPQVAQSQLAKAEMTLESLGCQIVVPVQSEGETKAKPAHFDCSSVVIKGDGTLSMYQLAFEEYMRSARVTADHSQTKAATSNQLNQLIVSAALLSSEMVDAATQIRVANEAKLKCDKEKN